MRISQVSHHLKKTSLWELDNQTEADDELATSDILNKATAAIRASLGVNAPQNIWAALGVYLQKQLLLQNTVVITNFGTFGFNDNGDPIFVQDPVFLHMTRLCLASRKRGNSVQPALADSDCIHYIDANELAAEYLQNCNQDLVKSVISSVLAWVVSWAKSGRQMRLEFLPVGEWICNGDSVDFRYLESFREEVELVRERIAEAVENGVVANNSRDTNYQVEETNDVPALSATALPIATLSVATSRTDKTKTSMINVNADASLSAGKEDMARNGSPVGRSQYKLRAPTFSSKAKQMPPHGQIRNISSTKANIKGSRGVDRPSTRNDHHSVSMTNPSQIASAANNIIASLKNARPGTASSLHAHHSKQQAVSRPTPQQLNIINRLRSRIINRRGPSLQGLNALVAAFKTFKSTVISPTQLSLSLRKLGVKISSTEVKEISAGFAHEKSNRIDTSKLIDALRGQPLSGARFDLVAKAFYRMDPACTGAVNIDEMIKHYDVGFLPQVRDGKLSRLEALTAFLQEWASLNSANNNTITFEAFVEYYHNVSACIGNDADFARLIRQAWHVHEQTDEYETHSSPEQHNVHAVPTTTATSAMQPTPMVTSLQSQPENRLSPRECTSEVREGIREETTPSDPWMYLRALLLFPQNQSGVASWPTKDNMCRWLGANRVLGDGNETMNVKAFAHALMLLDKRLSERGAYDLAQFVAAHCAESLTESDTIVLKDLYRKLTSTRNETEAAQSPLDYNYVEYHASRAIERIHARVTRSQSVNSQAAKVLPMDLNVLEKWLHLASSGGDSLLMKYELRSGLMKVGIDISYQDLDYIFAYFDVDRQGFIDCDAFLSVVRNPGSALPKIANRHDKANGNPATKAITVVADASERATSLHTTPPPSVVWRKKEVVTREPQPNYRRRNLIHRTIWNQTTRPAANESQGISDSLGKLESERRRRYHAAQLIQKMCRGFRARQIVAQLRRKTAAKSHHLETLAQEQDQQIANKRKTKRTALPSAYGF